MSLNSSQKGILDIFNNTFNTVKTNDLIEETYLKLERATGLNYTREPFSQIYIIINTLVQSIIKSNLNTLEQIAKELVFFDEEPFDGYVDGSYAGVRQGLLTLELFDDVKIYRRTPATFQVVLLAKAGVDLASNENRLTIASKLHELSPIARTFALDPNNRIQQFFNASTGQRIMYTYYNARIRLFDIKIGYQLNYEESIISLDFVDKIKLVVQSIYSKLYNKIGKNFVFRDFHSITRDISGLTGVSVTITENGNEIKDQDITIFSTEIFVFNKIDVVEGL